MPRSETPQVPLEITHEVSAELTLRETLFQSATGSSERDSVVPYATP
jgi:hypothetical protein